MSSKIQKLLKGIDHDKRFTEIRDASHDQYLMLREIDMHTDQGSLAIKLHITFRYDTERIEKSFGDFKREPGGLITANGITYEDGKVYAFTSTITNAQLMNARIPELDLALWEFIFRSIRTLIDERGLKHKLIIVKTIRGNDGKPVLSELDSMGKFLEF